MSVILDAMNTRQAFGEALTEYAETDPMVFAIGADTTSSMGFKTLADKYPDRVVNNGIAEQDMTLMAAGMASCGAKVFVATYAPFASMRMLEQVRTFCAYPKLDVKVIAGLGGLSGDIEGVTHQGIEDVSILRSIPNMTVVVPADASSTKIITKAIAAYQGPVYMRLGRGADPKVFDDTYTFTIGKANILRSAGTDAAVICNGAAVHRVLEAEALLREKGYRIRVIEMPCVKPLDQQAILEAAQACGVVVTVEEGSILGGLGGAVAEVLGENHPTRMRRIGIDDVFTESGNHADLMDKYNLHPAHIASTVEEMIGRK